MVKINEKIVRALMVLLIFPTIAILSLCYTAYNHVKDVKASYQEQMININDSRWEFVDTVLQGDRDKAQLQAEYVKQNVIRRLNTAYSGNMVQLRADLDSASDNLAVRILNEEITGKYLNNIQNDNNDMFIATTSKILADKSVNCAVGKDSRDWPTEISHQANQTLGRAAVDMLLYPNGDRLIYWKFLPDTVDVDTKYTIATPTITGLKTIYDKYGIEGLSAYEILEPAYIQKDSDIFGTPDVDLHGIKTNNYKLIVVQGFNLYEDLVTNYSSQIEYFAGLEKVAKKELNDQISTSVMVLILWIALLLAVFAGIVVTAKLCIKWGGEDAYWRSNQS